MPGLLMSFAIRWRDDPVACALVPFSDFVTGRLPTVDEYPFPYMSLVPGSGRMHYRSDRFEGLRRTLALHIWVDPDKLEDGEAIAEHCRRVWCNQAWDYDYGCVIDVLDGGPPTCHQLTEPTYQGWELVKLMTLCIEQPRVDSALCCLSEHLPSSEFSHSSKSSHSSEFSRFSESSRASRRAVVATE
jgi:hypothetical protein